MDGIEIVIGSHTGFWQNFLGRLALMWSYLRVRRCFCITLFTFFAIAIAITEAPQYMNLFLVPVFIIIGMWLSPIANELLNSIITDREDSKLVINLESQGFSIEYHSPDGKAETFYDWGKFYSFRENKKHFIFIAKKGSNIAIAKRHMSQEKLSIAQDILKNAPIEEYTKLQQFSVK